MSALVVGWVLYLIGVAACGAVFVDLIHRQTDGLTKRYLTVVAVVLLVASVGLVIYDNTLASVLGMPLGATAVFGALIFRVKHPTEQ